MCNSQVLLTQVLLDPKSGLRTTMSMMERRNHALAFYQDLADDGELDAMCILGRMLLEGGPSNQLWTMRDPMMALFTLLSDE